MNFDVAVIGVGGVGSAALMHLVQRGRCEFDLQLFDPLRFASTRE